jgi:putative PEP-CTERM system TPR-repeat lipoprotein
MSLPKVEFKLDCPGRPSAEGRQIMTMIHKEAIAAALLTILLCSGCATSPQAKEAKSLAAGKRFLAKKDYQRATLEFKNAIAAMPRDAEPYYQIGLTFAGTRDLQAAVNMFRKALELNPKHAGAQLELSRVMASVLDPEILQDAESRLAGLLQQGAVNPDTLNTLALTELKLGKFEAALGHLNQALKNTPQALNSSILMAQAMLSRGDVKGAEGALVKASQSAPKSVAPRIVLAAFYATRNRLAEAEQQLKEALAMDPENPEALLDMGRLQFYLGKKPEAERLIKQLSALPNKNTRPVYGMLLLAEGQTQAAMQEFERMAKQDPDDRAVRTRLVAVYYGNGRQADAHRLLEQTLKKNPKDLDALLQRGEMLLAEGRYAAAETDLNNVLRAKPNAPEVHYILSKLHQARGSRLLQRQELAEALKLNPLLLPVRLEYAETLLGSNAASTALTVLDEAPAFQRKTLAFVVARNWVLWGAKSTKELREGIDEGLRVQRTPDLLVQDALWKLNNRDFGGARVALEEALKLDPQNLRALEVLRGSYVAQKQNATALQKIKEYAAQQPKSASVQAFLGQVLAASGDSVQARAAFDAAKAADPHLESVELSLIQLDYVDGRLDSARTRLQALLAANPNNQRARLWLGDVNAVKGDSGAALEAYQQVLQADPSHAEALNNAAYLLATQINRPDEALKYAEKAHELAPNDPDYVDTLGWILYQKGLYTLAVKHFEQAASQKRNPVWRYHLAMACAKAGDGKRARAELQAALQENPRLPEAKLAREAVVGVP